MNEDKSISSQEGFVRLFSKYEGNVRAFVTSILPSWEGVDEVMQESSLIMWRKSDQFDYQGVESNFLNWAFTIARYEVLKYRRRKATDRLIFSEDVYELLSSEAEEISTDHLGREKALNGCLQKLLPAQQELIQVSYSQGVSIKDAASRVGRTPTGLYKALARIRKNLHGCVQNAVKSELTERRL
jgi:RNA polymerase sigma-70 factor, ECF subfamily